MIEKGTIKNQFYSNGGIDTEFLYHPTNSELLNMIHKYKALRIMLMQEGSSLVLVGMPAAVGDHGALATHFMQQGMSVVIGTLYHIVDWKPKPFLTVDGGYQYGNAKSIILQEFQDNKFSLEQIKNTLELVKLLPVIDCMAMKKAIKKYINTKNLDFSSLVIF